MKSLGDKWRKFGNLIFAPWSLILLIGTILLGIGLARQTDPTVIAVLTVVVTLTAGLCGGVLAYRWNELNEEKVIVARGRSAIRGLKLLLVNLASLDKRVCEYLNRNNAEEQREKLTAEIIRTYLEEVIGRCKVLEEEVLSSIENWTEVLPEADIKTQIGIITELNAQVSQLAQDIKKLEADKEQIEDQSQEEAVELRKEIKEKERQLEKTKRELREKNIDFGGVSIASGAVGLGTTPINIADYVTTGNIADAAGNVGVGGSFGRICTTCGYKERPGEVSAGGVCPQCKKWL